MSQNSLFTNTFKTPRTPPKNLSKSESELNKVTTRSQTKQLEKVLSVEKTKDDVITLPQDTQAKIEFNPKPVQKSNFKMEIFKLQKLIAVAIPEFNSEDKEKQSDSLTRFLKAADNIYESLKTEDEQNTFNKFIILKLGDEAFTRVNNRNINTYPEIKTLLKDIYRKAQSLEELERMYTDIKQSYGESLRNYGNRILESLEKYKKGFKLKYNTKVIDVAYEKHLNTNTVKIFKRGLSNTILKDKIITSTASKIEEIILESEIIERMLLETVSQTSSQIDLKSQNDNTPRLFTQDVNSLPKLSCNHCQKPGHTLADCRIRMNSEMIAKTKINQSQLPQRQFRPQYNSQQTRWNTPIKYCSYCKVTTGHTFDECQKKLFQRRPQNNNMNFTQPNYQGNQNFQQRRNHFNGQQQYQQSNTQFRNPQVNFVPNQQQYNKQPTQQRNYSSNYTPNQNNYQQRNSYPNQQPMSNYPQQSNYQKQQQMANHYNGQPRVNEEDLANMLSNMKINTVLPQKELVPQNSEQENCQGSSQN